MRVVHLLGASSGSLGRHVLSLAGRMGAAGWDVVVAGPAEANQRFAFVADGAHFVAVDIPSPDEAIAAPGRVAGAVRDARVVTAGADVVHAHGSVAGLVAASIGKVDQRPLVVTWTGPGAVSGAKAAIWAAMDRVVARRAWVVLAASALQVDEVRDLGARDVRHATLATPPLRPPVSTPTQVREELAVGPEPMLLAVGPLVPARAYDVMLDAVAHLVDRDPTPVLVIAGDGPERDRLAERIGAEHLPVRLIGRWPNVADLIEAADVAVLACRGAEGGWPPMLAREALRGGLPLVATTQTAITELVGDLALLVPPESGEALAAAIARVLDEPVLAKRLAAAGVRQAATWPDEDDTATQVLAVYDELLQA